MKIAKHTVEGQKIKQLEEEKQELNMVILRKDKEIEDIKTECAEQFKRIKDLRFINDYGDKYAKLRKIHEIASDNFSALVKDMIIAKNDEEKTAKIIKLPTTNQSNR